MRSKGLPDGPRRAADLGEPGISGIERQEMLNAQGSAAPVIITTGRRQTPTDPILRPIPRGGPMSSSSTVQLHNVAHERLCCSLIQYAEDFDVEINFPVGTRGGHRLC